MFRRNVDVFDGCALFSFFRRMEKKFDIPPVRVATHPEANDRIAIGFIDGSIGFYNFDVSKDALKIVAAKKLKSAVRDIEFSRSGEELYAICENKALCVYDVESNMRIRCIRKCHEGKPNALCTLPSSSTKGQQIATGDENGQIRTWDLRVASPEVSTFNDLEDIVNDFAVSENTLLAACSDGTLGSYELRRRKLIVRSESMSNELLSIAPSKSFTYVGNGEGYVEVFKKDEYANILERIETSYTMGVDCLHMLREDVLLSASNEDADLRLLHVNPNKRIGSIGKHEGGVQQFALTADRFWLISVGWLKSTVRFWNLPHILDKIPIIRAQGLSKRKGSSFKASTNFFSDLLTEGREHSRDDARGDSDAEDSEQSSEGEDDVEETET
uniref:WD repeat-containing protein 55 n=1 Tax=Ascaris suum TaxID=6253 RepID=F1L0Z9_ASCSU